MIAIILFVLFSVSIGVNLIKRIIHAIKTAINPVNVDYLGLEYESEEAIKRFEEAKSLINAQIEDIEVQKTVLHRSVCALERALGEEVDNTKQAAILGKIQTAQAKIYKLDREIDKLLK